MKRNSGVMTSPMCRWLLAKPLHKGMDATMSPWCAPVDPVGTVPRVCGAQYPADPATEVRSAPQVLWLAWREAGAGAFAASCPAIEAGSGFPHVYLNPQKF